jgi:hypothetical protein
MEGLLNLSRRHFLEKATLGLGALAISSFDVPSGLKSVLTMMPHFAPRAKRVIYLSVRGSFTVGNVRLQTGIAETSQPAIARFC